MFANVRLSMLHDYLHMLLKYCLYYFFYTYIFLSLSINQMPFKYFKANYLYLLLLKWRLVFIYSSNVAYDPLTFRNLLTFQDKIRRQISFPNQDLKIPTFGPKIGFIDKLGQRYFVKMQGPNFEMGDWLHTYVYS